MGIRISQINETGNRQDEQDGQEPDQPCSSCKSCHEWAKTSAGEERVIRAPVRVNPCASVDLQLFEVAEDSFLHLLLFFESAPSAEKPW